MTSSSADNTPPLVVQKVEELYPTPLDSNGVPHLKRYEALFEKFKSRYGASPSFVVRAPGRVNLIGEHVDYSGFGVLPMAIEKDVVIAVFVDPKGNEIEMSNSDERYPSRTSSSDPASITFPRDPPHWGNYFFAAYKELLDRLSKEEKNAPLLQQLPGLKLLVHGNVPPGSGLSSSSALVCASALAVLTALKATLTRAEMANLCAVCERYVGAESGGMDQAISYLAEAGRAKKIDFDPLRSVDVHLPDNATFVVVDSLVQHSLQSQIAGASYNIRVVECRLAAALLAKEMGLEEWKGVRRLIDVKKLCNLSFKDLEQKVEQHLHDASYSKEELAASLGSDIVDKYIGTVSISELELKKRAKHVFSESARVDDFAATCARPTYPTQLEDLGKLMNASQESCANLFNCSCTELEEVVGVCRTSGAVGARLTGAGWGGWAISLVPTPALDSFLEKMKSFYQSKGVPETTTSFISTLPTRGACVLLSS